jgi:hypothetical protein
VLVVKRKPVGVVIWLGQPFALAILGNQSGLVEAKLVFPPPEGASP